MLPVIFSIIKHYVLTKIINTRYQQCGDYTPFCANPPAPETHIYSHRGVHDARAREEFLAFLPSPNRPNHPRTSVLRPSYPRITRATPALRERAPTLPAPRLRYVSMCPCNPHYDCITAHTRGFRVRCNILFPSLKKKILPL